MNEEQVSIFALKSVFIFALVANKIKMAVPGNISSINRVCLVLYMKI